MNGVSLLIALRLASRNVLLIGGGTVASSRLFFLLEAGAHVTLVSPPPLHPTITHYLRTNSSQITYLSRQYLGRIDDVKVEDFFLVLTAIDDPVLSREVCDLCRERRVTVNVADVPDQCDFYFGAQFRRGPLQVMVSTQGMGPKVGVMVRNHLQQHLPGDVEEAIEGVGQLRRELRLKAPGTGGEVSRRRMEWMKEVCDVWGMDQMGALRDPKVRAEVLDGWESGMIVGPAAIGVGGSWMRWPSWSASFIAMALGAGLVVGVIIGRKR